MLAGNVNWNAFTDDPDQAPNYYVTVDGILNTLYSTHAIYGVVGTEKVILGVPELTPGGIDLLSGTSTVASARLTFHDIDGEASTLFGVEAAGAPVASWKNRKISLHAGYRGLVYADYVKIFTGRVTGLRLSEPGVYEIDLADTAYLIDGEIMTNATEEKPSKITGNVVNCFVSILRGVFSTVDADFPLDTVSTDTASSSVPTGLGIADVDLDFAGMKTQRDIWRPGDNVTVEVADPVSAREYLVKEFFRAFQAHIAILGNGALGFRFNIPAIPASSAPSITLDKLVDESPRWEQLISEHLNKFRIYGDYQIATDSYSELYVEDHADDTANRTDTGETVEYSVESAWITSAQDGVEIARELAGRLRQLWLIGPALVEIPINFTQRRIEPGDVVAVTHPDLPDQRTGSLGIEGRLMTVLGVRPDLWRGVIWIECLDLGLRRYGCWSADSQADYASATEQDRDTYAFWNDNTSGDQADGSPGYRLI